MGYRIVYPGEPGPPKKGGKRLVLFGLIALFAAFVLGRRVPAQWIAGNGSRAVAAIESWAEEVKTEEKIDGVVEAFREAVLELEK